MPRGEKNHKNTKKKKIEKAWKMINVKRNHFITRSRKRYLKYD